SSGLALLIAILLARALGPSQYGAYSIAMGCLAVLVAVGALGLPQVVTREVAAFNARGDWPVLAGLRKFSRRIPLGSGLCLGAFVISVALPMASRSPEPFKYQSLAIAALILPIQILTSSLGAFQVGIHRITLGQIPSAVIRPTVFLILIVVVQLLVPGSFSGPSAMFLNLGAAATALVIAHLIDRSARVPSHGVDKPLFRRPEWLKAGFPLMIASLLSAINSQADILMLGSMRGAESAGLYQV
ncbi:unnamed protein product, partial [marine sediment metagenome]